VYASWTVGVLIAGLMLTVWFMTFSIIRVNT
jgi:hypothetical protein